MCIRDRLYGNVQNALVLRTLGEFGYLGAYTSARGVVPFERFFVGGDGLANFALDGREVVQLRGCLLYTSNSVYSDQLLSTILGIKKGDTYNGVLLEKRVADKTKPDGEDLTNLYQNNGYLFSNINPVEVKTANDSIDFEIRVTEGPIAYFNKITVVGNDKTNDKVIYRELRTKPGEKYSKDDLVRTIRAVSYTHLDVYKRQEF